MKKGKFDGENVTEFRTEEQATPKRNQSIESTTTEKTVKMKIICKSSCSASMSWIEITPDGIIPHNKVLRTL